MKNKTNCDGVKINGKYTCIHCIRFANDIVILAESEQDINDMLKIIASLFYKFKLKINAIKPKEYS